MDTNKSHKSDRPGFSLPPGIYSRLSDAQLVGLTRANFCPAFAELMRRYQKAVRWTVARYVSEAAIDDVTQEVFLLAFQSLATLRQPERFGGWLRAIAAHRAERWNRSQRDSHLSLTEAVAPRPYLPALIDSDPAHIFLRHERQRELHLCLMRLSEPYREVLILRYFDDWPLSRIASYLSVSEDVVRGRLQRARAALRNLFSDEAD